MRAAQTEQPPLQPTRAAVARLTAAALARGPALVSGDPAADSITVLYASRFGEPRVEARSLTGGPWIAARTLRAPDEDHGTDERTPALLRVDGLQPDTAYQFRYLLHRASEDTGTWTTGGVFRTAPPRDAPVAVRFAWGGDVGGQNLCRPVDDAYPAFTALQNAVAPVGGVPLQFFVALGDFIYADQPCEARGRYGDAQMAVAPVRALTLADFRGRWRYLRDDGAYAAFAGRVPFVSTWDDHEVTNDFGPGDDTCNAEPACAGRHLMPDGLRAFLDFNPIATDVHHPRLHRAVRYGRHVELFVLDTRQHRGARGLEDSVSRARSLLGDEQRRWLIDSLRASDATWKFVISSVPISIPTGTPEAPDGWADGGTARGFERELASIFDAVHAAGVRNLVFLTTDVHFATGFRLRPVAGDPAWLVHEFTSGPLNAGLFPKEDVDPTFRPERLYRFGPRSAEDVRKLEDARAWFNFGTVDVDADGTLVVSIVDVRGNVASEVSLQPQPQPSTRARHTTGR